MTNAPSFTWLMDADVYGSEIEPLLAEVRRQGMAAELVSHRSLPKGPAPVANGWQLQAGDLVLGYGTFPFARQIQLHSGWLPGIWCDPVQLDCTNYYPILDGFPLNRKHEILPGREAVRHQERLFNNFGRDGLVFARPTSCGKSFVGRCIDRDSFTSALGPVRYDPADQVVIAAPISIDREWRLLIAADNVVAATQYARAGVKDVRANCPAKVFAFAQGLLRASTWRPDPLFFLDIGETDQGLGVVEVSGFSCSWI